MASGIGEHWLAGVMFLLAPIACAAADASDIIFSGGFEWVCSPQLALPDGMRTWQPVGNISYGSDTTHVRPNVNITEWDNLWGFSSVIDSVPVSWPGFSDAPAPTLRNFGKWNYVAAHFRTPAAPGNLSGRFGYSEVPSSPPARVTMAISSTCGDFAAHLPTPGCLKADVDAGNALVFWHFSTTAPDTACALQPGADYYVNIMIANPESVVPQAVVVGMNSVWQP